MSNQRSSVSDRVRIPFLLIASLGDTEFVPCTMVLSSAVKYNVLLYVDT